MAEDLQEDSRYRLGTNIKFGLGIKELAKMTGKSEEEMQKAREYYFRNQKPTRDFFQDIYVDHTLTKCGGLYEDSDFMDLYKTFDFSKALRIYKKYWLPYKSKYQDEESLKKAIDIMLHDN